MHQRRFLFIAATLLAVVLSVSALTDVGSPPAEAAATGSITGTVTLPKGAAKNAAGVEVSAWDGASDRRSAKADKRGKYTIRGLTPGKRYTVFFHPHDIAKGRLLAEYKGRVQGFDRHKAAKYTVRSGRTTTVNKTIVWMPSIEGNVVFPKGVDLSTGKTRVGFYTTDHEGHQWGSKSVKVGVDGKFKLYVLPGSGPIWGSVSSTDRNLVDQFDITLPYSRETKRTGLRLLVKQGGIITGKVTVAGTGAPPESSRVEVVQREKGSPVLVHSGVVSPAADGTYSIQALVPGDYTVKFWADGDTEYWNDAPDAETATLVGVKAGKSRTGIDAEVGLVGGLEPLRGEVGLGTVRTEKEVRPSLGGVTEGAEVNYEWFINGQPVAGATEPTFTPLAEHAGAWLQVKVTLTKPGHATTVLSDYALVHLKKLTSPSVVTVSGKPKVGKKLTAAPGAWTKGTSFTYQWYADRTKIKGATKSTFTVTKAQLGKKMMVKVAGSKPGYEPVRRTSRSTTVVTR